MAEVTENTPVEVALKAGSREAKASAVLRPTRRWRVFIVPTVHTDIGYTDLQDKVAALHASNTMQALALVNEHPSFNWDFETYWQLDCFLRAHPEKAEETFRRLREGRMGLSALFGNMLTGLCSHEALNRATLASRNLANKGGFELASVILDDVPSAVGSLPTILANAGIKYFIEGVNSERAPHATHGLHESLLLGRAGRLARAEPHRRQAMPMAGGCDQLDRAGGRAVARAAGGLRQGRLPL